jgi:hypothetical protein
VGRNWVGQAERLTAYVRLTCWRALEAPNFGSAIPNARPMRMLAASTLGHLETAMKFRRAAHPARRFTRLRKKNPAAAAIVRGPAPR